MRFSAATAAALLLALPLGIRVSIAVAAEPDASLWSVDVVADGKVPPADLEKAAGALRAGLRSTGKVVAPDAKSATWKLVAHVSENEDEFALRVDGFSATEPGVSVSGPRVLLEDGARRVAIRLASPLGKIAIPSDSRADWTVDGRKVAPEGGIALVVERGTHVVRATGPAGTAMAVVEVAGGETTPFPRAAIVGASLAASAARRPVVASRGPSSENTSVSGRRPRGPWLWVGVGAAALAAGGAAAWASQRGGSNSPVQAGTGTSTLNVNTQ